MKPKKLRRLIKSIVVDAGTGVAYEDVLSMVWKVNMNTPVKRIERAIRKMVRWGKIQILFPEKRDQAYLYPAEKAR